MHFQKEVISDEKYSIYNKFGFNGCVSNATTISDTTYAKISPVNIKDSSILVLIDKYLNYKKKDCVKYLILESYTDYYVSI